MSEVAVYTLYIDWNNDGDFADTGEDVSDDLIEATIGRAFSGPMARVPGVGRATLVLLNVSKAYSPPLEADVLPRRPVKLDMTYGGITTTLFRGFIESIEPTFGQYGERRATFECVDSMSLLDRFEGSIALQTDVGADDIISAVVSAVYTPPSTSYQVGINRFATSAEGWERVQDGSEEVRASQKIEDACISDWGRFFLAGDGEATFINRHQMPLDTSTELTLDDTMLNMAYRKAVESVHNYVEVTCYPRAIGAVNEMLARMSQQDAPRIEASDARVFVLRFGDPVNQKVKVGGLDCIVPVAGTDYVCTSDPAGGGTNENANVTPSATFYGDHAEITLTNAAAYPVFVQKLQVRGLAVRAREDITVVAQDATSITAYQKRKLPIKAPLISQDDGAQLLADYLLDYYKDPLNEVTGVEIIANKDATWMAAVRDLELCDKVVITETQTGLSAFAGFIYEMTHRIVTKWEHRLTFSLEEAYTLAGTPFRLDISTLDSGHVLIY